MNEIKSDGVRKTILNQLEALMGYAMEDSVLLDEYVLNLLHGITLQINKEVLIMTNEQNTIVQVAIGDDRSVAFSDNNLQSAKGLGRGRVIHTHPGGNPTLSPEDFSSAKSQSLQCMISIGAGEGVPIRFGVALPIIKDGELVYASGIINSLKALNALDVDTYAFEANKALRRLPNAGFDIVDEEERALLLGVDFGSKSQDLELSASMEELARLVETAGGVVVGSITQNRPQVDPIFYLGSGKMTEVGRLIQNTNANIIITNDELSAKQIACIEARTGCKTIDRTTIILDIFAKHAKTREGKLQVELAQQKYRISRLRGLGLVLSRTGGGIGTRGPGEKKLETDRRHIQRQVDELLKRIEGIKKSNALGAKQRQKNKVRTVALVGYTNSGKSTLFNKMTGSQVVEKDGLFVTLDSTMRQVQQDKGNYLMSDTVGFIEKLPHDLVVAFRTTLQEVEDADLLLHVMDASNPHAQIQQQVVEKVLRDMKSHEKDTLLVFNKMDKLSPEEVLIYENLAKRENGVCISAKTGQGIHDLFDTISNTLGGGLSEIQLIIPYEQGQALSELHTLGDVQSTEYLDTGTKVVALVDGDFPWHKYQPWQIDAPTS